MKTYDRIMVRFGELSTKGKNKKDFIRILSENIRRGLKEFASLEYDVRYDHIYVILHDVDYQPVLARLQEISGIYSLSLVYKSSREIEEIMNSSLELIQEEKGQTFKIKCKRSDKRYPMTSDQITREVAGKILSTLPLKVDVHNPEILLSIELRDEGCYIFCHTFPGAGGYSLG